MIVSISKVYNEIKRGKDDLFDWVETNLDPKFFVEVEESNILSHYSSIQNWADKNPNYSPNAKEQFAAYDEADPWLVAYAIEHKLGIVSQEVYVANIKRRIPIPNVCRDFGLRHIDTFALLRESGFKM